MVEAGDPTSLFALHAGSADEDVLFGVVEDVAHVEHARDVGGRHQDDVGLFVGVGGGGEKVVFLPVGVPFVFDGIGWVVTKGHDGCRVKGDAMTGYERWGDVDA